MNQKKMNLNYPLRLLQLVVLLYATKVMTPAAGWIFNTVLWSYSLLLGLLTILLVISAVLSTTFRLVPKKPTKFTLPKKVSFFYGYVILNLVSIYLIAVSPIRDQFNYLIYWLAVETVALIIVRTNVIAALRRP